VRIFLTGATGFIGGAIAQRLVREGHAVAAIAREPQRADGLTRLGVDVHLGDVTDRESLRAPMAGVDAVMHTAGWYKVGQASPDARRTNVDGTRNMLELMREFGIPRGVYTSTIAVHSDTGGRVVDERYRFTGRHLSLYDQTKAEAHDVAERLIQAGLPLTIVMPGAVYGPGDTSSLGTLWRRFLSRRLPPLPARTAFCWAHIDDIVSGHVLALTQAQPGRSYHLCGPAHTLVEAVAMASRITSIPAPRWSIPPAVMRGASVATGLIGRAISLPPEYTAEGLRVLAGVTYLGQSERARQELGWRARPLEDGLRDTLRHEMHAGLRHTSDS
jgi:nucleoside-diphosphate-sugar epimerase